MITPEAMREMAKRLDNSSPWSDTKQCDRNLSLASQMLRSIAAEREAREILVAGQEPLGAEFEAVWDANRTALYEP